MTQTPWTPFRRLALAMAAALPMAALGCGGGRGTGEAGVRPQPASAEETLDELFNLTGLFRRLGRIAAGPPLPFVGDYAFMAGRGDSTIVLLGLSLDNRALGFTRSGPDFVARYRVEMGFTPGDGLPLRYVREEQVTVPSFRETQRLDETVLFQQAFLLPPGQYTANVVIRDPSSSSFSRAELPLEIPAFPPGSFTAPILVYDGVPRSSIWAEPAVLLNPRGMVAHGDDSLGVYVEAYGLQEPRTLLLLVRDELDRQVHRIEIAFEGGKDVEAHTIELPGEATALGRLSLVLGEGAAVKETAALVSFSRSWALTNYDNLITLLRYFGHEGRLDALRRADPEERAPLWRQFWKDSDPDPTTPENEALDTYFTRVAIANQRFRDEGGQNGGWRTERGEVYITIGEPDQVYESLPGQEPRRISWVYNDYRAVIEFTGQIGFSRLRMTPASRAEFTRVRGLVRQRDRVPG